MFVRGFVCDVFVIICVIVVVILIVESGFGWCSLRLRLPNNLKYG